MNPVREVELISPAFKANPYPFYAQLRGSARLSHDDVG